MEDRQDRTRYFVVSGAVFHEDGLHLMKGAVNRFRENVFADKFGGNEIHVHDIYKGKRGFFGNNSTRSQAVSYVTDRLSEVSLKYFQIISSQR